MQASAASKTVKSKRHKKELKFNYPVVVFLMVSTILLYILFATCPLNGGISGILVFKDFTKLLLHAL